MQAIITRVLPATNTRPTRVKAWCDRGSITVPADADDAHRAAKDALIARFLREDAARPNGCPPDKNPWAAPMVRGGLPRSGVAGAACVFVFVP